MSIYFSHLDHIGNASMVDISEKMMTQRVALAKARVLLSNKTIELIKDRGHKKGDVLRIGQIAGIMGAKKTHDLIPLCHQIPLSSIKVDLKLSLNAIDITANCKTNWKTGVEMEALTSVSITALTIFDMCKSVDKFIKITDIYLLFKEGGKSGIHTGTDK